MIPVRFDSMNYECSAPTWVIKLPVVNGDDPVWVPCPLPNCKANFPNYLIGEKCIWENENLVCRACSKGYFLSKDKSYCDCTRDNTGHCVNCPLSCIELI